MSRNARYARGILAALCIAFLAVLTLIAGILFGAAHYVLAAMFGALATAMGLICVYTARTAMMVARSADPPGPAPSPLPAYLAGAAQDIADAAAGWDPGMRRLNDARFYDQVTAATHDARTRAYAALDAAERTTEEVEETLLALGGMTGGAGVTDAYVATIAADLITRQDWDTLTRWWRINDITPQLVDHATGL